MNKNNIEDINKNSLEELGSFAGTIAHDLNNILMAVLGHLSLLRLTKDLGGDPSLKAAEEGARKAADLSKQILQYAKVPNSSNSDFYEHSEALDLTESVSDAISLFSPNLPDTITVTLKIYDSKLSVAAHESSITQIVSNLLLNARDAMPDGGTLVVSLNKVILKDTISINGSSIGPGEFASIGISDSGIGMSEEIKKRIFEPFFTTKRGTGTGLGLATVFQIAKGLGGSINVVSTPGEGSLFSVMIPLLRHTDSINQEIHKSETVSIEKKLIKDNNTHTILVVDDEDSVRLVLSKSLEVLGYNVVTAENGNSALEVFSQLNNEISLVVMDMIMPNMPGQELFFALKRINNDVKVLISSGYASDHNIQLLLENGALGLIQKPFSVDELGEKIKEVLNYE